jgi:Protein of unknown function (DUF3224)
MEIETAARVHMAMTRRHYSGEVDGHSVILIIAAQTADAETVVAMESFTGSLGGRTGTFNIAHLVTTVHAGKETESVVIVPSSGTGELAGITGRGEVTYNANGAHLIWFEYDL